MRSPKRVFAGEVIGEMNRIAVAGKIGEGDHVVVHHRLHQRLAHADAQILEIIDFERRRHGSSPESCVADRTADEACAASLLPEKLASQSLGTSAGAREEPIRAPLRRVRAAAGMQLVAMHAMDDEEAVEPGAAGAGEGR